MSYALGTAAATNAPLRLQYTCAGDDFYSLAAAYLGSREAGMQIIRMQPELKTATINNKTIQAFVKGRPGWDPSGMRPYSSASNPGTVDAAGKPEGFAIFTANTQLMLPDMPRLDGKVPRGVTPPTPTTPPPSTVGPPQQAGVNPLLVIGAGLLVVGAIASRKDKKSKTKPGSA